MVMRNVLLEHSTFPVKSSFVCNLLSKMLLPIYHPHTDTEQYKNAVAIQMNSGILSKNQELLSTYYK